MNQIVTISHGSGGRMMMDLIKEIFLPHFGDSVQLTDSACLDIYGNSIAFTTDSFVVQPRFFPGGDIGKLAVCGTINDLAVTGAIPKAISSAFIIEEGFSIQELEEIIISMTAEAKSAGVSIVTGDTKVVEKGACDGMFITTSGIGFLPHKRRDIASGRLIQPGDAIIINGSIGEHGLAVMGKRRALDYQSDLQSDCACLNGLIEEALKSAPSMRFMRDATRGGLAMVVCELVENKSFGIELNESTIPIKDSVVGVCEILGFDPFLIANEGKVIMVVPPEEADLLVAKLNTHPLGENAARIGMITHQHPGHVILNTSVGGKRILDMPIADQLPRIC